MLRSQPHKSMLTNGLYSDFIPVCRITPCRCEAEPSGVLSSSSMKVGKKNFGTRYFRRKEKM